MTAWDLFLALLLPIPPWIGFLVYRRRGRVGLSFGYFLGGILGVLMLPWWESGQHPMPSAQLGGALFGFALFMGAYREGRHGLRRMGLGAGGTTLFAGILLTAQHHPLTSLWLFWGSAILQATLLLLLSDLGYRLTHGRWLHLRMPLVGGTALLLMVLPSRWIPGLPTTMPWPSVLLSGPLLGLVALQQLLYLRAHGTWVEGRGDGFRTALAALERSLRPEDPSLALAIEAQQPILLVNERGMLLEANRAFGQLVGLPRHLLRGYELQAFLQGRDTEVWEDLRDQLLRHSHGRTTALLVRRDGGFDAVELEAAAFDRNLALLWIAEATSGTLGLREELHGPAIFDHDPEHTRPNQLANALGTILPAVEQILSDTTDARIRESAELILLATQRLAPDSRSRARSEVRSPAILKSQLPRLNRMMPKDIHLTLQAPELGLAVELDALKRITTHLALQARLGLERGTVALELEPATLGGRPWGRLTFSLAGHRARPISGLLGLGWLLQAVHESGGILDLRQEEQGYVWPQVWLPAAGPGTSAHGRALDGLQVWIVDQDPLVREALASLARHAGASVRVFLDFRDLLREGRSAQAPDLLVMERTGRLERFRRTLNTLQLTPVPMLLLGSGSALHAAAPIAFQHHRVAFLEKPFPSDHFIQCLLALLNPAPARP